MPESRLLIVTNIKSQVPDGLPVAPFYLESLVLDSADNRLAQLLVGNDLDLCCLRRDGVDVQMIHFLPFYFVG